MGKSLANSKPAVIYAELCTLLAHAANIVNDQPIGANNLTESNIMTLSVNQLLLGHTSTLIPLSNSEVPEGNLAVKSHLNENHQGIGGPCGRRKHSKYFYLTIPIKTQGVIAIYSQEMSVYFSEKIRSGEFILMQGSLDEAVQR